MRSILSYISYFNLDIPCFASNTCFRININVLLMTCQSKWNLLPKGNWYVGEFAEIQQNDLFGSVNYKRFQKVLPNNLAYPLMLYIFSCLYWKNLSYNPHSIAHYLITLRLPCSPPRVKTVRVKLLSSLFVSIINCIYCTFYSLHMLFDIEHLLTLFVCK